MLACSRVAVTYYKNIFESRRRSNETKLIAILLVKFETGLEMHTAVTTCLLEAHA